MRPNRTFEKEIEALATKDRWQAAYENLDAAAAAALEEIVEGMNHRLPRVRRFCAALMDHHADRRCRTALSRALVEILNRNSIPRMRMRAFAGWPFTRSVASAASASLRNWTPLHS